MTRDAVIQFSALRFGGRQRVRLQAFPDHLQQFRLLSLREAVYFIS